MCLLSSRFLDKSQQSENIYGSVAFMSKIVDNARMNIEQIIINAGSQSELARLLDVKRTTVWMWKKLGKIPKSRIWQIQLHFPELLKDKK
jgi:DNA invertase Pin-like site-specific DNA recombinase